MTQKNQNKEKQEGKKISLKNCGAFISQKLVKYGDKR